MEERVEPDILHVVISATAAVNPLVGFVLFIGWHITLYHKIPEMAVEFREALERFEERVGSRKYVRYMGKAAGVFAKILPKPLSKPPENEEAANKILKKLKKLSDKEIKQAEKAITKFVEGGSTKDFLDEIKEMFKIENSSEVLDLFINIKDLIIDRKTLEEFNKLYKLEEGQAKNLESKLANIAKEFKDNLEKLEKDIFTLDEGFYWLTRVFFERNKSEGIDYWIEGWKPRLIDVWEGFDCKRKIVDEIEKEGNFLILGESGYSKSTTLYRVVCDLYAKNYNKSYNILISSHDLGGERIEHPQRIVEVVKNLLSEGNVLIAVDDVQNNIRAFELIKNLATYKNFNRIKFVFTARQPEFGDILETKKKYSYDENVWKAIDYSYNKKLKKIGMDNFNLEEAKGFVKKFYRLIHGSEIEEESLKKTLPEFYKLSNNGHPILLKYRLTGKGIEDDVEDKYDRYIFDRKIEREDEKKIEAVLFSCILDLCGIKITNDLTSKCKVSLRLLKGSILKYNEPTDSWETMHPVWDIEFLKYWNKLKRKEGENPEETIKQIVKTIVIKDKDESYQLISGLANTVAYNQEFLSMFEPSLEVPDYMDEADKAELYVYSLADMWLKLEKFEKCLEASAEAVKILEELINTDEKFKKELAFAHAIRGNAFYGMGDQDSMIKESNTAIKINPKLADTKNMRGLIYHGKEYYDSAIKEYNRAIKINPKDAEAYYNRGNEHYKNGNYDLCVIDWANAGFLFLIRMYEEDFAFFQNALMHLNQAFIFDKSEHIIKFEAGVASYASLKIVLLQTLNISNFLESKLEDGGYYAKLIGKLAGESVNIEKDLEEMVLLKVKDKKPALCASAKAVLTVLEGGDAEIKEVKNFKDIAFALLLNDLKEAKNLTLIQPLPDTFWDD